jgi:TatD DNase family protein
MNNPTLIDTHCHLNLPEAFPDPYLALKAAEQNGVMACIVVGIDRQSNVRTIELANRYGSIYGVVGWHPNSAASWNSEEQGILANQLREPKVVALGEIGLDFHWDHATREQQEKCLLDQLEMAASANLPVVIHCREAWDELLDILESRSALPYHFHCFSGNEVQAKRCLDLGGILGFDGPITYKKNSELREMLATFPSDRIVIETDSPYLSPEPLRSKPNSPANLPLINEMLASAKGMSIEDAARLTTENACRFFRIPIPN